MTEAKGGNKSGSLPLCLAMVEPEVDAYVDALCGSADGVQVGKVLLCPDNDLSKSVAESLKQVMPHADVVIGSAINDDNIDAYLFCFDDDEAQASALMGLVDIEKGIVIAAKFKQSAIDGGVFLISIPKAGTHLATELLRGLGYGDGGEWDGGNMDSKSWHYLEYSNSHTSAPDFFNDSVRRAPFGNRLHPFPYTPTLFIYRHPYDILVSEANYYHREGKTAFFQYLSGLSFEERVMRLIDDPLLLGNLRDRINKFAAWLTFNNVIPISFEELVGKNGGGDESIQRRTIWSVILKLQVTADTNIVASKLFNPQSPTFADGKIGAHIEKLPEAARKALSEVSQDYLEIFGYRHQPVGKTTPLYGERTEEFRSRPLQLARQTAETQPPVLFRKNVIGHNLIKYLGRFYGISNGVGDTDLTKLPPEKLSALPSADSLTDLEKTLIREEPLFLGQSILRFQDRYYGLPAGSENVDLTKLTTEELAVLPNAASFDELRQIIIVNLTKGITYLLRLMVKKARKILAWGK